MSFAVVEWADSSPLLVSVVPSNWLLKEGEKLFSYWSPKPIDDTVVKKCNPPQKSWPTYQVTLLGSEAKYNEALKLLRRAESRSDVEAESASDKKSRHERCRVALEDDDSNEPRRGTTKVKQLRTVPSLPSVPPGLQSTALPSAKKHMSTAITRKAGVIVQDPLPGAVTDIEPVDEADNLRDPQPSVSVPNVVSSTPVRARETAGPQQEACGGGDGITRVLLELTKQVADIKEQVMFNTQLLQNAARQQKQVTDDKLKLPCNLPLETYEAVLAVEQRLKSKEFYSQLVKYLSVIGGATVKDFISRTMNKLLHPDLAKRFVWAGRLTKKHAFKQLELASALNDAARKNSLTSRATVAEIEDEIKTWLRGAPDRAGGRAKRSQRKAREKLRQQRSRQPQYHNRSFLSRSASQSPVLRRHGVSPSPQSHKSKGSSRRKSSSYEAEHSHSNASRKSQPTQSRSRSTSARSWSTASRSQSRSRSRSTSQSPQSHSHKSKQSASSYEAAHSQTTAM